MYVHILFIVQNCEVKFLLCGSQTVAGHLAVLSPASESTAATPSLGMLDGATARTLFTVLVMLGGRELY